MMCLIYGRIIVTVEHRQHHERIQLFKYLPLEQTRRAERYQAAATSTSQPSLANHFPTAPTRLAAGGKNHLHASLGTRLFRMPRLENHYM
jgi:hypothetical protein